MIKTSIRFVSTKPRHFINIGQLSNNELLGLISRAEAFKRQIYTGEPVPMRQFQRLLGKVVTMLFTKRSTRTRVSTNGAAAYFGASAMFLGKDDIQLGVNESIQDTAKIISSMTSCVFARVDKHQQIMDLCNNSSVPIINALCDKYHPLQTIADLLTIKETFGQTPGLKLTWIGDANNVINDLTIGAIKSGISVSVCIPKSITFDEEIAVEANKAAIENNVAFEIVNDPITALENANIIVTDTWISMGQETETAAKLKQFANFQITQEMISQANVLPNWKFMHCLPRHSEEVSDDVFYSDDSIVFQEGENRLYAALAAIEGFVINKGDLLNAVDKQI